MSYCPRLSQGLATCMQGSTRDWRELETRWHHIGAFEWLKTSGSFRAKLSAISDRIWRNHPHTAFSSFENNSYKVFKWSQLEYFSLNFHEIFTIARAIQDLRCDYDHSTCMVSLSHQKDSFSIKLCAQGCEPREPRWVGGGWWAVTAEGCWLSPVRRQTTYKPVAITQFCPFAAYGWFLQRRSHI